MSYPLPRLRNVLPGETFILRGETKLRTLINTDRHYGHFAGGRASLCHELDRATIVWDEGGWRTESRSKHADAVHG